jgi:diketogulonate reductase-like aldo/keto reductase
VIVGAKRADQLADNIASTEVELEAAELEELDKLSTLPREYPGWMFQMQGGYSAGKISERRKPK